MHYVANGLQNIKYHEKHSHLNAVKVHKNHIHVMSLVEIMICGHINKIHFSSKCCTVQLVLLG